MGVQNRNQVLPATPAEKALKKQSNETEKTGQSFFDLPFDNTDAPARETVNNWNPGGERRAKQRLSCNDRGGIC